MTRTVYINGRYSAPEDATVSIFDRGLLFADAIYEVAAIIDSRILEFESHMQRLDRSLAEMGIPAPLSHEEILDMMRELARRNNIKEGLVYMQITRGSDGDRDFLPSPNMTPTVFAFAQAQSSPAPCPTISFPGVHERPCLRWLRKAMLAWMSGCLHWKKYGVPMRRSLQAHRPMSVRSFKSMTVCWGMARRALLPGGCNQSIWILRNVTLFE